MYGLVGLVGSNLAATVGDVAAAGSRHPVQAAGKFIFGLQWGLLVWVLVGVLGVLVGVVVVHRTPTRPPARPEPSPPAPPARSVMKGV